MASDFSKPVVGDNYSTLLPALVTLHADLVKQLEPTDSGTSTNVPTNAIRWNKTSNLWEKYNGTAWAALSSLYAIAISGNAGSSTAAAITDDTTTNATMYPAFGSASTGNVGLKVSSTKFTFNPSTGVLGATSFSGAGTGLTGTAGSLSIGGSAAVGTTSAVTDDTATAAVMYPVFSSAATGNNGLKASSTKFTYNPSTGVLGATSFSGAGTGLTGTAASLNIGGTATSIAGGSAGSLPFQTAPGVTAMLAAGTAGQYLASNGASGPIWTNAPAPVNLHSFQTLI